MQYFSNIGPGSSVAQTNIFYGKKHVQIDGETSGSSKNGAVFRKPATITIKDGTTAIFHVKPKGALQLNYNDLFAYNKGEFIVSNEHGETTIRAKDSRPASPADETASKNVNVNTSFSVDLFMDRAKVAEGKRPYFKGFLEWINLNEADLHLITAEYLEKQEEDYARDKDTKFNLGIYSEVFEKAAKNWQQGGLGQYKEKDDKPSKSAHVSKYKFKGPVIIGVPTTQITNQTFGKDSIAYVPEGEEVTFIG